MLLLLLLPGIKYSQFLLFFLVVLASHAIHAIHAQANAAAAADACKAGSCLDFRSLSASCGYDIDLDQSRQKTWDETMCVCSDSSYTRISNSCFGCIGALGIAGYNSTQWGDDCYEAYSQAPQKSAATAATAGVDRVIYSALVMAAASMRLQHVLACTGW
ncbi:uncharacterized protein LAJ45_10762 [Morchella importuna]|uniref:uncharacterized protein n=1 Tax=Morchella importuna TaxID=1174673 RepID=UPI001E8E21BD|nr:uncharacterized protein LAJ45_10762 [Morchella importuna]KAH8145202.1 hypothetical protein LAJ45_10762 [Morchella importuna]